MEVEKDAQRKPEQTSMAKQQMSRNKGTRQEDDNKSKECFDASFATGNLSVNNSSRSTSHSKEKFLSNTLCMNSIKSRNNVDDYVASSFTSGAPFANSVERLILTYLNGVFKFNI